VLGFKAIGIMLVITAVITGGFYWYYTDTQKRMAILYQNSAKLETIVQIQELAIEQYNKDIKAVVAEKSFVQKEFTKSRLVVERLRKKFNKVSKLLGARDLGKLGAAKPKLIGRIINKATKEVFRCFEIASGAKLTEKEENAFKPSQINKSCSTIANPQHIGS
jgi:hypothetical protein